MPKTTLYQFEMCPYCTKVRAKLDELGFDYEKVNVSHDREDPQRKMLFKNSGAHSVPVIEIDGKFIGESDAIVKKLESMSNN